ncbi:MAG: hypothetical protein IT290_01045 [Deltaproteobacteria bacterium]|nr:hypothetical protein [Deltaproteobacteria bacterium]
MSERYYAVIGKPVLHSKSPQIQSAAFAQAGLPAHYVRLAVSDPREAVRVAREIGLSGMNVTAPFKEEVCKEIDFFSSEVDRIGAANTVRFTDEGTEGYNTDTRGILGAFEERSVSLRGKRVLVLGAGGAARSTLCALASAGATVTILNRSAERGQDLADQFGAACGALTIENLERGFGLSRIVINLTTARERIVPPELFTALHTVLDAQYGMVTPFLSDARAAGSTVLSGEDWLIHQGAAAFEIFTGRQADQQAMRAAILSAGVGADQPVALIGMMGAGKSTVGKELAARLDRPYVDLDAQIEANVGSAIPDIFRQRGEPAFRALESQALVAALEQNPGVISCGGGIVLAAENRRMLQEHALPIWLWAEPSRLAARVGAADRPLLQGKDPFSHLTELLRVRKKFYAEVCELVVSTHGFTPKLIAERLEYEIGYIRNGSR